MNKNKQNQIFSNFQRLLNKHGYGFQYTVIKLIIDLSEDKSFPWMFEVSEFPVNIQGYNTHIDLIVKHKEKPVYLICECKRVNPVLSDWCFAKAPNIHRKQRQEYKIQIERIKQGWGTKLASEAYLLSKKETAFHISLELKSDNKGESYAIGKGSLNDAVTQTCRGVNGIGSYLSENKILKDKEWIDLIPVIFTTANLWSSDIDLSKADLLSGNLDFSSNMNNEEWIWYQYHLSPSLRHSILRSSNPLHFYEILDTEYARSIAIVNSTHIQKALIKLDEFIEEIDIPFK